MLICIKQQLSNIWSSIREKVKQHWGWVEKKQITSGYPCPNFFELSRPNISLWIFERGDVSKRSTDFSFNFLYISVNYAEHAVLQ